VPERRCIVTRESGPKEGLIRFVVGPDDAIVPDLAERLPGPGIWVSADRAALDKAATKGLFPRAAKRAVRVEPDLVDRVEAMLAARLVDRVAMARKAGQAVTGLEKTKAALVSGRAALLLQASDGSERGKAALRPPEGANTLVECLSGRELGLAFGRDNVIHAAVLAGGLGERIRIDALRLSGVRAGMGRRTSRDDAANGLAGEGPRGKG
jgi:predicted RNA-binding protein YlxR (DUF448 family)